MGESRRRQSTVEWPAAFVIGAVILAVVTGEPLVAIGLAVWATVLLIARLYLLGLVGEGRLPMWAAVVVHIAVPLVGVAGLWLFASVAS